MKKIPLLGLIGLIAASGLSTTVAAKTVLSAKELCFQVGDPTIGGWNTVLKIKPQQALTSKIGAVVAVVGLEHGSRTVDIPLSYYNEFSGAASYIASGYQDVVENIIQISLTGTGYGTDCTAAGIAGLWSFSYSLMLDPKTKGKILSGRLVGDKTFKATEVGHGDDPEVHSVIDNAVTEVSCKGF